MCLKSTCPTVLHLSFEFHSNSLSSGLRIELQLLPISEMGKLHSLTFNHLQKILEKLRKLRKSCTYKRNINRMYYDKLYHKYLQQLPTLRLNTRALFPVFLLKIRFNSNLVENNQKAMLSFYFTSKFSVKTSKF